MSFPASIDGVAFNSHEDRYYFFFGPAYVTKEVGDPIDGLIRLVERDWKGFPWPSQPIDAVTYSSDNQKYYFFKGDEYARAGRDKKFDRGYPRKLNASNSGFQGMPWTSIDAAVYKSKTKTYYFFKDGQYAKKARGSNERVSEPKQVEAGFKLDKERTILGATYKRSADAYYFFYWDKYRKKKAGETPTGLADYTPTWEWRERLEKNWVGFTHDGGYVGKFQVDWKTAAGDSGKWGPSERGGAGLWSHRVPLPSDVTEVSVQAWAYRPFEWVKIVHRVYKTPPNAAFRVYGTAFDPSWKKVSDPGAFWERTVERTARRAIATAGDWVEGVVEDLTEKVFRELAIEEVAKHAQFLVKASAGVVAATGSPAAYTALADELVKALTGGGEARTALTAARKQMEKPDRGGAQSLVGMAERAGLKSVSTAVSVDANKVGGATGALGAALSLSGSSYTLFGGAGLSIASAPQVGGAVEFGFWAVDPEELSGPSVTVSVSDVNGVKAAGLAVVFSVSDPLNPSFVGFTLSAGVGLDLSDVPGFTLAVGWTFLYD